MEYKIIVVRFNEYNLGPEDPCEELNELTRDGFMIDRTLDAGPNYIIFLMGKGTLIEDRTCRNCVYYSGEFTGSCAKWNEARSAWDICYLYESK